MLYSYIKDFYKITEIITESKESKKSEFFIYAKIFFIDI